MVSCSVFEQEGSLTRGASVNTRSPRALYMPNSVQGTHWLRIACRICKYTHTGVLLTYKSSSDLRYSPTSDW